MLADAGKRLRPVGWPGLLDFCGLTQTDRRFVEYSWSMGATSHQGNVSRLTNSRVIPAKGNKMSENTKTVVITNDFNADAFRLIARCEDDRCLSCNMQGEDPIDSRTDAHDIASLYESIMDAVVLSVDHDKDTIILTVA